MRRILILLFWVIAIGVFAQEKFESVILQGKVWKTAYQSPYIVNQPPTIIESRFDGDTIIDGIAFKRKFTRSELREGSWQATNYYVGQKGGQVFYFSRTFGDEPRLLMDFSAKESDVISVLFFGYVPQSLKVIAASDTILESSGDQTRRRCLYVQSDSKSDIWVEGIGSLCYGVEPYLQEPLDGALPWLQQCLYEDVVIFKAEENISNGIVWTTREVQTGSRSSCYDLLGRRVSGQPQHRGVYVKGNRKIVVR